MPASSPDILISALIEAFQDSESSAVLLSNPNKHPRAFAVSTPEGAISIWIYIKTLTPGGRPNLPFEYRIQKTGMPSPMPINPAGYTLLLGYEPNLKMFAGFDLHKHLTTNSRSPSVQIDIRTVDAALRDGFAFDRKDNDEIAVGIRPDQLLKYAANSIELHRLGASASTFSLLQRASALEEIPAKEFLKINLKRQRVVKTVSLLARNANFRSSILLAYDRRCAVTGVQLKLVDAAHILPVGAPGSTDEIRNGFCLSPTYHRAYDNALIYLDEDFIMHINPAKEEMLSSLNLDAGLPGFKATIGKKILLPPNRKLWPDPKLIGKANEFRRIGIP